VVTGVRHPPPPRYYATWAEAWDGHAQTLALFGRALGVVMWIGQPRPMVGLDGGKRREKKPARRSARPAPSLGQMRSHA
jgi:hypothetical protein